MSEKTKIIEQVDVLSEVFGGSPSEKLLRIIFTYLQEYTDEQLERGVKYLIRTRVYPGFPLVGEIIKAIEDNKQPWETGIRL